MLFRSEGRKVSPAADQMIGKLVISKSGRYFVFVTGGKRELRAAMEAYNNLQARGYKGANVYSKYYFEKYHMDEKQAVTSVLAEEEADEDASVSSTYDSVSSTGASVCWLVSVDGADAISEFTGFHQASYKIPVPES